MPQVPSGVIEQFLHPPVQVLTRELVSGTSTGSGSLTRVRGPVTVDAFGLVWSFITIPAKFGVEIGTVNVYQPRMVQLSVVHTLLDGHDIVSQLESFHSEGLPFLWNVALPTRIDYYLAPGVTVQFAWLLAL